jgi:hypothetical protein
MSVWARRILIVAAIVTLAIAVQQRQRVVLKLTDPLGGHINDFDRWMMMVPEFVGGRADYVDDLFPMPPFALIVLWPLTALSRPNAQFVWVCCKLPFAYLVYRLTARLIAGAGAHLTASATALVIAGWWLPIVLDMQQGQTNFLVVIPLVAALVLAQRGTRSADSAAGWLIGLAAAFKVTPVVFAAYFFWKRRWLVAALVPVSLLVWLVVVPSLVFGAAQNARWLEQWGRIMIVPYVTRGEVLYPMSQSFGSFALRLLTPLAIFETTENGVPYGHYMNVVQLTERTVSAWVVPIMVTVVVAGLWWTRRRLPSLRCRRYLVEIGGVTALMLWFSERTWVHHYVSFVLTLGAAGAVLSELDSNSGGARALRRSLLLFAGVTVWASDAGRLFGRHGVEWTQAFGVFLWPSVVVTAAMIKHGSDARQ